MKKLLLSLATILLPMTSWADYSGTCGNNVTYVYNESTQTLTISGTGEMTDYSYGNAPWQTFRDEIIKISIEEGVKSIGNYAFYKFDTPTSITIPNSLIRIGNFAFLGWRGLKSITIGKGLVELGNEVFVGCTDLASISVSEENETFDSRANCNAIIESSTNTLVAGCKNSIIPNSITTIGNSAFVQCKGLTSISIPNSVTAIGKNSFYECVNLVSLTIGSSVNSIDNQAFYGCHGLTSISIPESVKTIGDLAFYWCSSLTSLNLGNKVTSIGNQAFSGCNITSVVIPGSVVNVGNFLSGCGNLSNVELSDGTQAILKNAFEGCNNLNSITLPSTIQSIGLNAFPNTTIKDVYCYATSVEATNKNAFNAAITNAKLHVPASALEYYRTTEPWSRFGTIEALDGTTLPQCATPTIQYEKGRLIFNCLTEDVKYSYEITDADIRKGNGDEIQLSVTYNISVYATKEGHENSEVATATLCWIDVEPRTEGLDENAILEVKALPVLLRRNDNTLSISGTNTGNSIRVFDIDGRLISSSTASGSGITHINIPNSSKILIVDINGKCIKIY